MSFSDDGVEIVEGVQDESILDKVMHVMDRAFDPQFGEAWNREQCRSIFSLPGYSLTLAYLADRLAGFALFRTIAEESELMLVAVDPAHRGIGIGFKLIDQWTESVKANGIKHLLLEVRNDNPARILYQKFGFYTVGRRRDYYTNTLGASRDALTMLCIVT